MNQPPDQGTKVFLYIVGIALGVGLLLAAFVLLLLGLGVVKQIPIYIIWAIILFAIGLGILGGISVRR
ncbi:MULTISPECIES: hypothetical protein [unclassified Coleofasciculus]|uniref:hypothetical protein n=1 Tax=unclassified Coleofasciculus TaxID=2692782 RepID=UPI0018803364|nr:MULTISPECIES: hypothetical protein [unclassified Coleofasciculus]MBE9125695.1 hypothetical protein [Coleofasciculus sp. LEGE 07081]MBE9148306.1 hypothetical protein [Coleofasciculus sp. LEGE 07092]